MVWEVWKRHSQHTWFCHCYLLSLLEAVAAWGWFWWGWKISCRCLRHSSLPWLEHLKARNWGIQRCHPPLVVCTTTSRQSHFSHFTRSLWFREITNHYLPLSLVFWWHLGLINGSPKHHQVTLENSNIKLVCMYCVVCMYVLLWEGGNFCQSCRQNEGNKRREQACFALLCVAVLHFSRVEWRS